MSKLPIFEHFLSVGNLKPWAQAMFQAKTQAKIYVPVELCPCLQMSRWTPVVKDLVDDAIDGRLDAAHFPFHKQRQESQFKSAPTRYEKRSCPSID